MASPSVSAHGGLVQWQCLLLVVSLLNFWSQPTAAQVIVESKDALKGTDVRLRFYPEVPDAEGFLWYKERQFQDYEHIAYLFTDPISTSRGSPGGDMMVEEDGSLLLKNVSFKHTGMYTVVVELQGCQKMIACGSLDVYPLVSVPTLVASKTTVTKRKDTVVMTCYTDALRVKWFFKGESLKLSDRVKLSGERRVLTINPVQRKDAGEYHCKGFNPMSSSESAPLELYVIF